jgi:acyl-homoserine-lactone acylase
LVLNGNSSGCAWDEVDGVPQKGLIPGAKLPILKRDDYVQNSNDSAWMTNPNAPLTGFPPIVSLENQPLRNRTRIGLDQIAKRLDGTDQLDNSKRFNANLLQQIAFSNQSYSATHLLSDLRKNCERTSAVYLSDANPAVDVTKACRVLRTWDGKANLESVGWKLYQTWFESFSQDVDQDNPPWGAIFNPANPVHTPSGLKNDATTKELSLKALAKAVYGLEAAGVDYELPWGQSQFVPSAKGNIPIHGGGSEDIYNQIQSNLTGDSAYQVYFGSSIVMTVSFDGDTPKAQGFLTYSQSSNPASPNYRDQTLRFSKKEWITFPFTSAVIA